MNKNYRLINEICISEGGVQYETRYMYNNNKCIREICDDKYIINYQYDDKKYLIKKVYPDGGYIYYENDENGNCLTMTYNYENIKEELVDNTYDYKNRLLISSSIDGMSIIYTYYEDNRVATEIRKGGEIYQYYYDDNKNLKYVHSNFGNEVKYMYDSDNNCFKKVDIHNNIVWLYRYELIN